MDVAGLLSLFRPVELLAKNKTADPKAGGE
jgi:hypothetical protein